MSESGHPNLGREMISPHSPLEVSPCSPPNPFLLVAGETREGFLPLDARFSRVNFFDFHSPSFSLYPALSRPPPFLR